VGAVATRKSGEAGLLAIGYPAKDGVLGLGQSGEHVLEHVAGEGSLFWQVCAPVLPRGFLLEARLTETPRCFHR